MQIIDEVNKKVEGMKEPVVRSRSKRQDQPSQVSMNQQTENFTAAKSNEKSQKQARDKLGSKSLSQANAQLATNVSGNAIAKNKIKKVTQKNLAIA